MAQLGQEQSVGGVTEAGAPDLSGSGGVLRSQQTRVWPQGDTGPTVASTVQQVLQVDVARGEQVGGGGVKHGGELQNWRPLIRVNSARDGGAESLITLFCFL